MIHEKPTRIIRSFATNNKPGSHPPQSSIDEMPHILVYGGMGGGKSTRVRCLLSALYGPTLWKQRKKESHIIHVGEKKVEMVIYQSKYHFELDATKLGTKDKAVVQHFVKEKAELLSTTSAGRKTMQSMFVSNSLFLNKSRAESDVCTTENIIPTFSVVVIDHADKLSLGAQQGLRRTMEVYGKSCKLILIATSTNGIIPALLSRVASVRVPLATNDDILRILKHIVSDFNKREKDTDKYDNMFRTIAARSEGNLKKAILVAQRAIMSDDYASIVFTLDSVIKKRIMNMLCQNPSPSTVVSLRNTVASILISSVSHTEVIASVTKVGGVFIEKKRSVSVAMDTIKWITVCLQASECFGKGGEPLSVVEYMLMGFVELVK